MTETDHPGERGTEMMRQAGYETVHVPLMPVLSNQFLPQPRKLNAMVANAVPAITQGTVAGRDNASGLPHPTISNIGCADMATNARAANAQNRAIHRAPVEERCA